MERNIIISKVKNIFTPTKRNTVYILEYIGQVHSDLHTLVWKSVLPNLFKLPQISWRICLEKGLLLFQPLGVAWYPNISLYTGQGMRQISIGPRISPKLLSGSAKWIPIKECLIPMHSQGKVSCETPVKVRWIYQPSGSFRLAMVDLNNGWASMKRERLSKKGEWRSGLNTRVRKNLNHIFKGMYFWCLAGQNAKERNIVKKIAVAPSGKN